MRVPLLEHMHMRVLPLSLVIDSRVAAGWVGISVAGWVSSNTTVTVLSTTAVSATANSAISSAGGPQEAKLNPSARIASLIGVRMKVSL